MPEVRMAAVLNGTPRSAVSDELGLEQMRVVEDMRRTLREIRDVNKLDSN
jgi:hypothetical protein